MVEFWSSERERVVNHLRYRSSICRNHLLLHPFVLSPDQADALDAEEHARHKALQASGCRRHHVLRRCVRLPGPLLPVILAEDRESTHHPLGIGRNFIV
eukprot:6510787-Karenia_brevis.AAC.1